jgi:hypothetical protein
MGMSKDDDDDDNDVGVKAVKIM